MALAAAAFGGQVLLLCALLLHLRPCSGNSNIQTAVNITWSSINFKTILEWEPKPSNYVYTVEIDGPRSDWMKTCVHTTQTECDVTYLLKNVRDTYTARILSDVPLRDNGDFDQVPYAISPDFIPYDQTLIGMPTIESFEQKKDFLKVVVEDPLTPYRFLNSSFKSIRDLFRGDLEYTLYYWKDKSTGRKEAKTRTNEFKVSIDKGKSYCFYVQATILSRTENRKGEKSFDRCTHGDVPSDDFELEAILVIGAAAVGVFILFVISCVVAYKCKKAKAAAKEKENVPLNA
ncbi:tissue factor [Eublepharis macularius]|uniref:Tissue factor n=1 Tax=Eublepharis macularius TaxID=481883 RepID=A0AA97JE81_EUBMA|nr:tissue factor [Eublepharis macularius]